MDIDQWNELRYLICQNCSSYESREGCNLCAHEIRTYLVCEWCKKDYTDNRPDPTGYNAILCPHCTRFTEPILQLFPMEVI